MVDFIPLEPSKEDEWDQIVASSDDAWLFHLSDAIHLQEQVLGAASHSVFVLENGRMLGICPLILYPHRWRRMGIWPATHRRLLTVWGKAGPAFLPEVTEKQREKITRCLVEYIDEVALRCRADDFEMTLSPLTPAYLPAHRRYPRCNPYVFYGFEDSSSWVYLQDLSVPTEHLTSQMSHAMRKNINRAQRSGVTVGVADSAAAVDEYYELHKLTYTASGMHPHPKAYFELIWKYFVEKGRAKFFFAQYQGERIDFLNVACFKSGVAYWTTSSNPAHKDLRANSLVIAEMTKWAKESGYEWIEVGEVFPNADPLSKDYGIYRYKKGIGGEIFPLFKATKKYGCGRFGQRPARAAGSRSDSGESES